MVKIVNKNLFDTDAEVICQQVNCKGVMENGINGQVKERYPAVYAEYKKVCEDADYDHKALLGTVLNVPVSKKLTICSLFGQDNYIGSGFCFTDYKALRMCLEKVRDEHKTKRIAMPYRMSCSLAGGDWRIVEEIILDTLGELDVTICRQ